MAPPKGHADPERASLVLEVGPNLANVLMQIFSQQPKIDALANQVEQLTNSLKQSNTGLKDAVDTNQPK